MGGAYVVTGLAAWELTPGFPVGIGMLYGHRGTRHWIRCGTRRA